MVHLREDGENSLTLTIFGASYVQNVSLILDSLLVTKVDHDNY